jgi:hypothetical protein
MAKKNENKHYHRILDIILSHHEVEAQLEAIHCITKEIVEYIENIPRKTNKEDWEW